MYYSMISKIRCHRECTSESLFGMLFVIVYFSIFKVFVYYVIYYAAVVRNNNK